MKTLCSCISQASLFQAHQDKRLKSIPDKLFEAAVLSCSVGLKNTEGDWEHKAHFHGVEECARFSFLQEVRDRKT